MKGRPWLGGFVREDSGVFIIRRSVNGKRYDVSTRCMTERAALKQLERFEVDPANYSPGGDGKEPVFLDVDLAQQFLTFCRDEKKNSPLWLGKQRRYVAWWSDKLKGISLARASLTGDIEPALEGVGARAHRIATIKAVYSWLRKTKHLLTPAEDPTFATLTVPQSDPNARMMADKAIPKEDYEKARKHLTGHWKAALEVQLGTGWHLTEVKRFAEGGAIEQHPRKETKGVAGVLVCPQTKEGGMLRTAVGLRVAASASQLLKRGTFSIEKYGKAVKAACLIAGVEPFAPGRFRHTVATAAINSGNDPAVVSAFLNHKNPSTTRKFYATHAVATKITTPL